MNEIILSMVRKINRYRSEDIRAAIARYEREYDPFEWGKLYLLVKYIYAWPARGDGATEVPGRGPVQEESSMWPLAFDRRGRIAITGQPTYFAGTFNAVGYFDYAAHRYERRTLE